MNLFFENLITRRDFFKKCLWGGTSLALLVKSAERLSAQDVKLGYVNPQPALHYRSMPKGDVKCLLCPRECVVKPGLKGLCRARENRQGKYFTIAYGNPCAVHIDPIEKKPFFHFLPGTTALSIAVAGCNFTCKNCQNWDISQAEPEDTQNIDLAPEDVVAAARKYRSPTIAYTYTEPVIFFEYMCATCKSARKQGVKNVLHSNGYINQKPLEELCQYLDAADIDLKGFTNEFYTSMTSGTLAPVLATLKTLNKNSVHLEITNLIIPTKNDNPDDMRMMYEWIVKELGPDVPLHISRFYPMYKLTNLIPTPAETLKQAYDIAREAGLHYVYIGNLPGQPEENTYCPKCKKAVIERVGYTIKANNLKGSNCKFCGFKIAGVWG